MIFHPASLNFPFSVAGNADGGIVPYGRKQPMSGSRRRETIATSGARLWRELRLPTNSLGNFLQSTASYTLLRE